MDCESAMVISGERRTFTPPAFFSSVDGGSKGKGATATGALLGGAVVGAVVGAGIATAKKAGQKAEE